MAEVAAATIAAVELTVETANWIKRNLPSQKIKEGFALLYNGMLLLYTEFDNLPLDIKTDLLNIYDAYEPLFIVPQLRLNSTLTENLNFTKSGIPRNKDSSPR